MSKLTPVTLIIGASSFFTVISHEDLKFPSFVVTAIIALPSVIAVTFPFSSTFAIFSSLEVQVTSLFVAFEGDIVAFNSKLSFIFNSADALSKLTPATFTSSGFDSSGAAVQLIFISIVLVACEALPSSVYQGKSMVSCVGLIWSLNSFIPEFSLIPSTYTFPYSSIAPEYNLLISSSLIVNSTPYGTLALNVNSFPSVSYSILSP